jgi:hypothetical protein
MATLAELAQAYLNQGLPSISGIFQPRADTPVEEPVEETIPGITPLFFQQMGGGEGGGGGPYNINPNDPNVRTSRNYVNPFPYDPMDDFGTPDYGYIDPPKEGLAGLFETYVKGSPLMRLAGKGLDALGNMIPPNRAGILQNELLGGGFMLDNTGKIVTNNYNTPEGIMAGYNPVSGGLLNLVTGGKMGEPTTYGLDKAYDKRRETISKTLKDKYNMSDEDIEAALAGEYEGDVETDLIKRLDLLNKSQNLFNKRKDAADIIFNRKVEERQQKALEKQRAAQAAAQAAQRQSDQSRINRAYREETGGQGGSYATGKSGVQKDGSYNDPFDPGGGE